VHISLVSRLVCFTTCLLGLLFSCPATAADSHSDPEAAWQSVVKASEDTSEGKAIRGRRITGEERLRLRAALHPREWAAADLAADFRSRFPDHTNAPKALKTELQQLTYMGDVAVDLDTNLFDRIDRIVRLVVTEERLSEKERFNMAAAALNRATYARVNGLTNAAQHEALLDLELRDARFLRQALPGATHVWTQLQLIAGSLPADKARPVIEEILAHAPPGPARTKAAGLKWKLEAEGKPFALSFTAVDGRTVDTAAWRGKVVLVDFWATWCGPCVAELPKVREIYDRFHQRGFEIVGISLDDSKTALEKFQAKHHLPWPQYFDGKGWNNDLVVKHGISLIPTVWLIDKRGVLRDMNARQDLAAKVQKLVEEP
jgi:peroxiredoxin